MIAGRMSNVASLSPSGSVAQQGLATPTPTYAPYPGGNTPVSSLPTPTAVATGVYEGDTYTQIADDVAGRLDGTWATGEPTIVISATITAGDAVALQLAESDITFQSDEDVALLFSGDFHARGPGLYAAGSEPTGDYMLVVVDTDTGGYTGTWLSDSQQELEDMLP